MSSRDARHTRGASEHVRCGVARVCILALRRYHTGEQPGRWRWTEYRRACRMRIRVARSGEDPFLSWERGRDGVHGGSTITSGGLLPSAVYSRHRGLLYNTWPQLTATVVVSHCGQWLKRTAITVQKHRRIHTAVGALVGRTLSRHQTVGSTTVTTSLLLARKTRWRG